ncbi:MAG: hypothetical protein QOF74_2544, partial [Caballeronia mineralivorans]|nr:hypothetical protein [Caballeronia mineralivorans]
MRSSNDHLNGVPPPDVIVHQNPIKRQPFQCRQTSPLKPVVGPVKVLARTTSTDAKETVCWTTVAGVEYLQAQHARPEMEDPRVNHLVIASIVFACVFGSGLLGLYLRELLPAHHLSDDSIGVVKLATGLIATMAALVLGLLISSAKSSFDTANGELVQ